jgi:hypothetical protein
MACNMRLLGIPAYKPVVKVKESNRSHKDTQHNLSLHGSAFGMHSVVTLRGEKFL